MGNLSKKLQNYYEQKGNKVIFRNEVSLNHLSLEMWEILGYKEIDASVLSRVLSGERFFTYKQLRVFCNLIRIDKKETRELINALTEDLLSRHKIEINSLFLKENSLDLDKTDCYRLLNIIRLLRKKGCPNHTIELASFIEKTLAFILKSSNFDKPTFKKLLAQVYNEKSRAYGEITSSNKVLCYMNDLNNKAIEIGKELKDQEILNMAYMNVGGAYYVAKKWKHSADFLEDNYHKVDRDTKIEFLRTLLLNYSYQNDFYNFKRAVSKSFKVLGNNPKDNLNNVASFSEARARSLAIFGHVKEARKILVEARKFDIQPFYESQILRGYISTFLHEASSGKKIDKEEVTQFAKIAFQEKYKPYKRHRQQVKSILKKLNIPYG